MYGWIWRRLPGARWVKTMIACGLVVAVIAILFQWVFPWLAPLLPFQQQTVGG